MLGTIIEYIEHGRFVCAVVTGEPGKRLHLLNLNGREVKLAANRVVHQSRRRLPVDTAGRDQLIAELKEICALRANMELPVSLHEVWQLIAEEGDAKFAPRFLAELCFGGEVDDDQEAAFLRAVFEDKIYFKYRGEHIRAHSPEAVAQLIERREREREKEAFLDAAAVALRRVWRGEEAGEWERDRVVGILRDYYLLGKECGGETAIMARDLLKRAGLTAPHDPFHVLVKLGVWSAHENLGVLRHGVPVEFGPEALAQGESIVAALESEHFYGRRDYRDLPLVTVDGAATRDFDDALHIERRGENFLVGVHISDVAGHIPPKSPLFREAEARVSSLYFPDAVIPMLPPSLSEGALSLIEGRDRPAVSCMVTLSPDGEVLSYQLVRSLVRVRRQLTYEQAERQARRDGADLHDLLTLSVRLKQRRIKAGALIIPIPDVNFRFDERGDVAEVRLSPVDSPMRSMVAEYMVLANTLFARFLADRQEPGLYRSQGPARKRFFSQPDESDLFVNFRQRRFLSRGNLTTTPKRHDGVGVEQYTTVTSPIRRLLDLVVQHQITGILAGRGAPFMLSDLNEFAAIITSTQSRLNVVRQLRHRYWLFRYLERRQGERFSAFVLDKRNRKVQVVLRDFLFEGELPFNNAIRPDLGDEVMVRVARVSAMDNIIRLEWG